MDSQQRILEVATALSQGQNTVLDRSLGFNEGCLSARQLVHSLQGGILSREAGHLSHCAECRRTLAGVLALSQESGRAFIRQALNSTAGTSVLDRMKGIWAGIEIREIFRRPRPIPALVGLVDNVLSVDPHAKGMALTCDVFPVFEPDRLAHLKRGSVRVSGAIVARNIPAAKVVVVNEGGHPGFLRVTVTNGELAPRVRAALQQGQHVIDTIQVSGNFDKGAPGGFIGQARLEFRLHGDTSPDTFSR